MTTQGRPERLPELPAWELMESLLQKRFAEEWAQVRSVWVGQPEFNPSLLRLKSENKQFKIYQSFRPTWLKFASHSFHPESENMLDLKDKEKFDLALVVPTRQRVETLAIVARALLSLRTPESWVLFVCENSQGAAGYMSKLREVCGDEALETDSARKCKWVKVLASQVRHPELLRDWLKSGERQLVPGTALFGEPGIFGWNQIDQGSAALVEVLPSTLSGRGADFGSGYGYLSQALLERCLKIESLHLIEADARALACARNNLAAFGERCRFHWLDIVSEDLIQSTVGSPLDWIVMNPPFHEGRESAPALGQDFIRKASLFLKPQGQLFLVANAFLPYEKVLRQCFRKVQKLAPDSPSSSAFKIYHSVK